MTKDYRKELEDWMKSAPEWISWKEVDVKPSFRSVYQMGALVPTMIPSTTTIVFMGQAQVDFTK